MGKSSTRSAISSRRMTPSERAEVRGDSPLPDAVKTFTCGRTRAVAGPGTRLPRDAVRASRVSPVSAGLATRCCRGLNEAAA